MAYPVTTERRKGQGYIQRTLAAIRAGLQGKSGLRTAVSDWLEDRTEHFTLHDVCKGALQRDMTRMSRDEVIRLGVLLRELGCQRIQKRVAGHPARFWWIPPTSSTEFLITTGADVASDRLSVTVNEPANDSASSRHD